MNTRRIGSLALLLCVLPGCLKKETPVVEQRAIPVKSLLAELPDGHDAQSGVAAYITTPFKKGLGVLKHATNEVVTARHNVLTPYGQITDSIIVGVSQPNSPTLLEMSSTVIAQDPESDLVLLRLEAAPAKPVAPIWHGAQPAASGGAKQAASQTAAMPAAQAAPQPTTPQGAAREVAASLTAPDAVQQGSGTKRLHHSRRHHAQASNRVPLFQASPKVHVVYDGP